MSETTNLKLKKHDNPETNTEKFDIENYLNGNWDKIDKNVGKVNTDILNINSKNKEQDTNIGQLQENTKTSSNKIAELEKELKEAQEDFYQNSIRGQANGEYIHVEDSNNCRAKIGISGNHEQETSTQNENLLILEDGTQTLNGVTMTIKDGFITFNGTATASTFFKIKIKEKLKTGDYYHLAVEVSGSRTKNIALGVVDVKEKIKYSEFNGGGGSPFNLTNDEYITYRIWVENGNVINNKIYRCMISKGSEAKKWVKGIPNMPSPDYLSSIVAVGSNVNLCNGINQEYYLNIYADLCGVISGNTGLIIPITEEKYTISTQISQARYRVACIKEKPIENSSVKAYNGVNKDKTSDNITINTSGYAYLIINATDLTKIKIEKGTVATPWSPYGQGSVKVTKCNKNLAIKNVKGYFSMSGFKIKIDNNSESFLFYAEKGKEYTRSCKVNLNRNRIGKIDTLDVTQGMTVLNGQEINSKKFICDDSGIYIWFVNSTLNDSIKESFQIEESSTETTFVQHEEQSYIMPVQKEMLQGDYFDFDNEEEVHTWGKLVLNGTEKIGISGASTDEILAIVYDINNAIDGFGYSNCFLYSSQVALNKLNVYNNGKNLRVCVDKSKFVDLESFKSKIIELYNEGTPVMIYYKLQTPTRLAFTDEQKAVAKELNNARTYKNVTNITTDSKAILSLDYAKDQETQNQKMQNEIDEIKQLLSTTQTSALLLDNMQTDIESEVK